MVNRSIKAGDHVLVLNDGLKVWVDSVRGPNLTAAQVLPTGVADLFLTSEPPDTNGLERPYALFFGNLARWQGIDYLLSAKDSPAWPRDVDLVVVGDGEMRRAVMDSAGDGLRYLGKINPNELAPLVAGALVTLCPKLDTKSMANTTTPFKILESVAAGVPVIATDIPAQRSMIEAGGYGLLVDLSMPAALARAVATVHDDAELRARLSQRARAARSELSWEYASTILASALARAATDAETR
jgi:glycosyltransferase involved in cell wall biosynthesis